MKKIVGIIQEHMFTHNDIKIFETGLKNLYREHYDPNERVVVFWMIMPKGYAYSERKLSEATVILIEVNEDVTQEKREELMGVCSQFLMNNFSVSPLDSVISVANTSFVDAFFNAQRQRVDPAHRLRINFKLYGTALLSRIRNGYLRLPVKLA